MGQRNPSRRRYKGDEWGGGSTLLPSCYIRPAKHIRLLPVSAEAINTTIGEWRVEVLTYGVGGIRWTYWFTMDADADIEEYAAKYRARGFVVEIFNLTDVEGLSPGN